MSDANQGLYKEMAENIANMSNKDAANILKCTLAHMKIARGNAKSIETLLHVTALQKAIEALENTENKKKAKHLMGEPMKERRSML